MTGILNHMKALWTDGVMSEDLAVVRGNALCVRELKDYSYMVLPSNLSSGKYISSKFLPSSHSFVIYLHSAFDFKPIFF